MHPLKHKDIKQPRSMILPYTVRLYFFPEPACGFYGRQDLFIGYLQ